MKGCPLVKVPPHSDLIDKEVLYNKTESWEARAIAYIAKLQRTHFEEMDEVAMADWLRWAAILGERSAFKFDVFDAPVVIEAE